MAVKQATNEIVYGRTPTGQCLYDALSSSMSAAAVHRKYPQLSRDFVLRLRSDFSARGILRRLKAKKR